MLGRIWKKSTRSNGTGGNQCVEACVSPSGVVKVRHSRNPNRLDELIFTADEWRAFLAGVKAGEFDIDEQEQG